MEPMPEKYRRWIADHGKSPWSPRPAAVPRRDSKPGVATPRTDQSLPDCGCTHVPPWEHCQHSEPALEGAELAHIRSM